MEPTRAVIGDMDRHWLGNTIRTLRKAKKWTQKDLQSISGVSERSIQEIETAKGNPSLSIVESIEGALGKVLIIENDERAMDSDVNLMRREITLLREQNKALHEANALVSKLSGLPLEIQLLVRGVIEKNPRPKGLPDNLGKALQALISRL